MKWSGARAGTGVRKRWRRLVVMAPPIAQCAAGAALAWSVAKDVLEHPRPFFAPIAVVICVGISLGQRLRRLAEMVIGVTVGVGVGDLLISQIGSGPWQIALVVALALATAVFLDTGSVIVLQAGSSAVLVATLLPPGGTGGFHRMIDALTGGLIGIAMVALLPADPVALARYHAAAIFDALAGTLLATAEAIERRDPTQAADALEAVRGTHTSIEAFEKALETGTEISIISPIRWRSRRALDRYVAARAPLDYALRNSRVLSRRTLRALIDGEQVPKEVVEGLRLMTSAVRLLQDELAGTRPPGDARAAAVAAAESVGAALTDSSGLSTHVVVAQVRSIGLDLLDAIGTDTTGRTAPAPAT
ncbi:FUSC family protein [Microtetraspora glauca]|uniref:FUSC family protein n=1 Tax=Microtetraspora glauca TaxID=1996 RepID=A0ABV3GHI2_MICGL